MKVQIKDLKPNPFRDIDNYPINEEKVQSLINSINQTGFWDNILARKNNGNIQIAYGHHRLVALWKIYGKTSAMVVNIPVRELDDSTMIRIMANENDENWGTKPEIINETVRVVMKYLKEFSTIIKKTPKEGGRSFRLFEKLPLPEPGKYRFSVIAWQISQWLGGNWTERRIFYTLDRLKLIEKGELDKEASESLPTEGATEKFTRVTKQIKTTPEQQKQAVKRIIENGNLSESGMKSALLDEKYKGKEKGKEERDFIEFKNYVMGCTKEINILNGKLGKLLLLEEELKPDMLMYRGSIEARDFDSALHLLINILKEFLGKEETECQKQIVSK